MKVRDTIEKMEDRITDELANKINKICLFEIGCENETEYWIVDFTLSKNRIYKGSKDLSVACKIIVANKNDWFSIVKGDLNPTTAFMHGKIKIKGDISTALKMQTILSN
jgi:putative sterol carrier protein